MRWQRTNKRVTFIGFSGFKVYLSPSLVLLTFFVLLYLIVFFIAEGFFDKRGLKSQLSGLLSFLPVQMYLKRENS